MSFQIKDLILAIIFALLGGVFVSTIFINFIFKMSPLVGLIFGEVVFVIMVVILSKLNLVILAFKIDKPLNFIGMLLITIALAIIMNWGNIVNLEQCTGAECFNPTNLQSFDGIFWSMYAGLVGTDTATKLGIAKLLTYIFTPFILTWIGASMLKNEPVLSPV